VDLIENWPGAAETGIEGAELAGSMLSQVMQYDIDFVCPAEVTSLECLEGGLKKVHTAEEGYTVKAVIITGGTQPKKIPIDGLDTYMGDGVYCCVLCDGDPLAGKPIAIIGGGDSGVTAALYMARLGCKITLIEATPRLNACKTLCNRLDDIKDLEIKCATLVRSIAAEGDLRVLSIEDQKSGEVALVKVDGVFLMAGRTPHTSYLKNLLELDSMGFIKVTHWMKTNVPGVFAAGDVRGESAMQIVTAAGDGATAAIAAEQFVNENAW
jgi:thioredoxin reductase (NADPH)